MWSKKTSKSQRKRRGQNKYHHTTNKKKPKVKYQTSTKENNAITKYNKLDYKKQNKHNNKTKTVLIKKQYLETVESQIIGKYLSCLESKYILSDIISTLKLNDFDENDEELKVKLLDSIISKLTQKMILLNNLYQHKHYTLAFQENKKLVSSGYIHQSTTHFIPIDIIKYIFKFYDNSFIWNINDNTMNTFKNSQFKEVMHGPQFKTINGMTFDLLLYPNGWKDSHKGYVACYVTTQRLPDDIENILVSFSLYLQEIDFEFTATRMFISNNSWSWNPLAVPFKELKNMASLNIHCCIDVIHINYKSPPITPKLLECGKTLSEHTQFVWNMDDEMLIKIKHLTPNRHFYSGMFGNNYWRLSCKHHKYNKHKKELWLWVFLDLLKLPLNVKRIYVDIIYVAYGDNIEYKKSATNKCLGFELDENSDVVNYDKLCPSSLLESFSVLSFMVEIEIQKIIYKD